LSKGVEWIRLLYCYEERVTDELIEIMASRPRILKYIDLPLQHISDRILRNMRRASTGRSIRDTILRLRRSMPGVAIRTTFITGLPGEAEQDFDELYSFVEDTRFDRLGVFAYSPEEGTDAASMPGQVDHETAEARRDALMRLQQKISLENNRRLVGTVQDVIVCTREGEGVYVGRTRADAPDIDCEIVFTAPPVGEASGGKASINARWSQVTSQALNKGFGQNNIAGASRGFNQSFPDDIIGGNNKKRNCEDIIGEIVKVRITDAFDYDLAGEIV